MCRGNGLRGGGVLYGNVREHGPRVVVQECLERLDLGILAGGLFQNGTARMLTAYCGYNISASENSMGGHVSIYGRDG